MACWKIHHLDPFSDDIPIKAPVSSGISEPANMGQKHRPKPVVAGNWPGNLHVDAMKDDKTGKLGAYFNN